MNFATPNAAQNLCYYRNGPNTKHSAELPASLGLVYVTVIQNLVKFAKKTSHFYFFAYLDSSHDVLRMIFRLQMEFWAGAVTKNIESCFLKGNYFLGTKTKMFFGNLFENI